MFLSSRPEMTLNSAYDVPAERSVSPARRIQSESTLTERGGASGAGWLEVVALSLLVPLGIACVAPSDPLLSRAPFPSLARAIALLLPRKSAVR